MTDINELQRILDGAPDGATHVDAEDYYWLCDGIKAEFYNDNKKSFVLAAHSTDQEQLRSLSDIRTIVELTQRAEAAEQQL